MSHMRPGMPERGSYDDLFKDLERRVRALETAARLPLASIGEGGITVQHGGQVVFLDPSGDPLTTLDSSGLVVGPDVVIDETGLEVEGGKVRAIDVASGEASAIGQTLTTTYTQKAGFTVNVPTWANSVICFCWATVSADDDGFGPLGVLASARINDVDDGGEQSDSDGLQTQALHITEKELTSFGATIEFSVYARRNGGSGDPTTAICAVRGLAIFLR